MTTLFLTVGRAQISPRQFLVQHLTPKLQFLDNERDVVILRVKAWGIKDHRKATMTIDLTDYRDMETGFFAMNRTVGFTASIGAQMVFSGQINTPGVLSPARDVPPEGLLRELQARGMHVEQRIEPG